MPYRRNYWRSLNESDLLLRTIGLVLSVIAAMVVVFIIVNRVNKNTTAIEKGCVLLNNAIVKSSTTGAAGQPKATRILLESIIRNMTPEEKKAYNEALRQPPDLSSFLVDCVKVAKHPEKIKALQIKPPPPGKSNP